MAAHRAPSSRQQLRTTALTAVATALAVVGLLFAGSALSSSPPGRGGAPLGTTTGPVALLDAPAASPTTSTTPAVRTGGTPRTSTKPTTGTTRKPTSTTTPRTTSATSSADDEE